MLKPLSVLVTAVCFALPCAAWADVYPVPSVPLPAGPAPQRLSPRQVFHLLDTNHDGFLSLQEFLSAPWIKNKPRAARFFRWMDTDRDGLVTLPEFLAAYARYRGPSGYTIQVAYPWPGLAGGPGITAGIGSAGWHYRAGFAVGGGRAFVGGACPRAGGARARVAGPRRYVGGPHPRVAGPRRHIASPRPSARVRHARPAHPVRTHHAVKRARSPKARKPARHGGRTHGHGHGHAAHRGHRR